MRHIALIGVSVAIFTAAGFSEVSPQRFGVLPSGADIFARVDQANAARAVKLHAYTATRRYSVLEPGHPPDAELVVAMDYVAPSTKTFKTVSSTGVGWIQRRVFRGLINAEQQAASGLDKANSALTPANYDAEFTRYDQYRGRECYVLSLTPKRRDKYLWKGSAWIDVEDLAIARIEAEPVMSPSFWVVRAPFTREFQRIDGFWLPWRDETHSQIRIVGEYVLHIEYSDYHLSIQP